MRIPDNYLDCVVYIYPNMQAAEQGEKAGGSGFLVYYPKPGTLEDRAFVVTNRHVIEGIQNPVVRVNRKDGPFESLQTNGNRWKVHPQSDDIAAIEFHQFGPEYSNLWVDFRSALPESTSQDFHVGIGDTVAMVGRLIGHDGRVRNSPIARFGTTAMMPGDTITNSYGAEQVTYLIECHSVPGFSGSPVFLFLSSTVRSIGGHLLTGTGPWLLGIDWYHANLVEKVRRRDGNPLKAGFYVKSNTGVAGVIPAARILQLLDSFDHSES